MLLDGLNHVAIITNDSDRLHAFYTEVFDATVQAVGAEVEPEVRMSIVHVGPALGAERLRDRRQHARPTVRPRCSGAGRIDHMALQAESIEAFETIRDRLIARGAADEFVTDFGPILSLFFTDPDGLECEVCVTNPDAVPGVLHPPGTPAGPLPELTRAMAVEFHLFQPQMRLTIDALVERARGAEAAGFAGIWGMDHLMPPMANDHPMYEAMTTTMLLAARTERIAVGNLVLCDAFRHPAMLAREAVTIDHASGGRFELGIGSGSVPDEIVTFGIGPDDAKARVRRLAETLTVVRALWTGEPLDFDGEFFHIHGGRQLPVPTREIPIVIGGTGPRTMELVARARDVVERPGAPARPPRRAPRPCGCRARLHAAARRVRPRRERARRDHRDRAEALRLVRLRPRDRHRQRDRRLLRVDWPTAASSASTCGSPTSPRPRPSPRSAPK